MAKVSLPQKQISLVIVLGAFQMHGAHGDGRAVGRIAAIPICLGAAGGIDLSGLSGFLTH